MGHISNCQWPYGIGIGRRDSRGINRAKCDGLSDIVNVISDNYHIKHDLCPDSICLETNMDHIIGRYDMVDMIWLS